MSSQEFSYSFGIKILKGITNSFTSCNCQTFWNFFHICYSTRLNHEITLINFRNEAICKQDDICLEYLKINNSRYSLDLTVRNVSDHKVTFENDTINYNRSFNEYVHHCSNDTVDFKIYQNPGNYASRKSYAPWNYVINSDVRR